MSTLENGVAVSVLEEAAFSIIVVDALKSGHPIVFGNTWFENMMGYDKADYLGKNPKFLQGEDQGQPGAKKLRDAIHAGQPSLARLRNYRKDGTMFLNEVYISPIQNESGDVTHYLGIHNDITDFTKKQADLNQAQNFLEAVPDAMVIVDKAGVIQFATPQTQNLLGYTADELTGMNVDGLVPMKHRGDHAKRREQFQDSGKNRLMGDGDPLFAQHKDGHDIPVEVSLNPITTGDGTLISASLRDISARVEAEQEIRDARDKAEEATLGKSRFLAAASHDLRQPLQSLSLYLTAMQTVTQDNPKARDIGLKMQSSLSGMKDLLDALLDISKLESGSVEPEHSAFSAQSIINAVVADFAPLAKEKGLTLTSEITHVNIRSDLALLMRIIENFVANAIRYTDTGEVSIGCTIDGDNLRFSVKDTGIGIPADALENVFDEYYQLGNAHRDQGKGLGLGLSVVKHIAELLDHELEASSVVGKGSVFSVTVPISHAEDVIEIPAEAINVSSIEAPIILCIDDNEAVLDSLSMMLDVVGYDIFMAGDGPQALAHIEAGLRPNIILSDYRLPGPNGVEVVKSIRQNVDTDIPVIMMTGDTSGAAIRQEGLDKVEVLSKPVDVKQLLSLIEQMAI